MVERLPSSIISYYDNTLFIFSTCLPLFNITLLSSLGFRSFPGNPSFGFPIWFPFSSALQGQYLFANEQTRGRFLPAFVPDSFTLHPCV